MNISSDALRRRYRQLNAISGISLALMAGLIIAAITIRQQHALFFKGMIVAFFVFFILLSISSLWSAKILFLDARRRSDFSDELWRLNTLKAANASWLIVFLGVLAMNALIWNEMLEMSAGRVTGLIAIILGSSYSLALAWYEWRDEI